MGHGWRGSGAVKTVLLLTSTIRPFDGLRNNDRSDPALRLRDYKTALSQYLALPRGAPDRILYVDNSGHELAELEALAETKNPQARPVDFLSIDPVGTERRSKPYGEMDILDQAMARIGGDAFAGHMIWKVTGRLFVPNFQDLVASMPAGTALYCDLRDVPLIGDRLGGNPWFDMRLWAYTPEIYAAHFLGLKDRVARIDEGVMFRASRDLAAARDDVVPRFRVQPRFLGYSGRDNRDYDDIRTRLKNVFRGLVRRVAPGVWI